MATMQHATGSRLRLQELRERAGLTQVDLAKRLRCSASYLSQIEQGARDGHLNFLLRLADFFDVSLDELVKSGGRP